MNNINRDNIELLCRELETTKVPQAIGMYHDELTGGYCALGIAYSLATAQGLVPGQPLSDFYGAGMGFSASKTLFTLKDDGSGTLSVLGANDEAKQPFWTIAQRIRETYLKDES